MNRELIILKDSIPVQQLYQIRRGLTQWEIVLYDDINACNPDVSNLDVSNPGASAYNRVRRVLLVTGRQDNREYDGYYEEYDIPYFGYGEDYHGDARYVALDEWAVTDRFLDTVWARYNDLPLTMFRTARLTAREITVEDLPKLYELYAYPGMTEFVEPLYEYEREVEFTSDYIRNMYGFYGYGLWLIFENATGKLIGRIGLENRQIDGQTQVELGYMVGSPFWRRGYAKEMCDAILEYAFAEDGLNLEKVALCTTRDNKPSKRLASKLGFKLYATNKHDNLNLYYKYRNRTEQH